MVLVQLHRNRGELRKTGPKIQVVVDHFGLEKQLAEKQKTEFPAGLRITALIDTGASITLVTPEVVRTCGLRQTSEMIISVAGRLAVVPEYAAALSFPGFGLASFDPINIVAGSLPKQDIACLIGRDILQRWRLTYDGRTGEVEIEE